MKIIVLISTFLISSVSYAQDNSFVLEDYIIKVKPIKSDFNKAFCDTAAHKKLGVVIEFDVVNQDDIKKFGDKIYAMDICYDYPGDGIFESKEIWDLKISEKKYYLAEIRIINSELLDKNIDGKKYWIRGLFREVTLHCISKSKKE